MHSASSMWNMLWHCRMSRILKKMVLIAFLLMIGGFASRSGFSYSCNTEPRE